MASTNVWYNPTAVGQIKRIANITGPGMVIFSALNMIFFSLDALHWIFGAFSYWLPFHGFLGLCGTGVCLFCNRWRFSCLGLVIVACSSLLLAKGYVPSPSASETQAGIRLRVLQANLFAKNEDPSRFFQLIDESRPDLMVLQEVAGPWEQTLSPLPLSFPHGLVGSEDQGVRKDLKQYSRLLASKPESLSKKGVPGYWTVVTGTDMNLNLISIHTRAPFSPYRAKRHKEQMKALTDVCKKMSGPLIVVGDFNSSTWSQLFRELTRGKRLVSARSGFGILGTWPSSLGPFRTPIDHILVSPEIQVLRCWVGPDIGSDHRPLLADLLVPLKLDLDRQTDSK